MKFLGMAAIAAGAVAGLLAAAPSQAATFADYSAADGFNNVQWTQSDAFTGGVLSSTSSTGGPASVYFSFLTPSLLSLAHLQATFSFTGTAPDGNPAASFAGFLAQPNLAGNFAFTYAGAPDLVVDGHTFHTGANLLSGTFGGAAIVGQNGATSGSTLDATSSGGSLVFHSDFLTFLATGDRAFALSMTSIADPLHASPGQSLDSFGAVSTGSFQADIAGGGNQGGIPEPATWAMMILGFGAVGLTLRRRRTAFA
jgi:hypothetical protein